LEFEKEINQLEESYADLVRELELYFSLVYVR